MRVATSPASRVGASNALPSSRPRNASATSVAVRTFGGGAGVSSWRAPSRQIASTIPVSAERVERAGVDVLVEREQRTGHRLDQAREPGRVDERRRPAHGVRTVRVAGTAAAPRALAQERHHRAARGELDRPDRDPTQPADALADALDLTGAGRDQPTQHVADRDRLRVGARAAGKRHRAVAGPARAGRARRGEHLRELVAVGRRRVAARRPRDDPARFPRDLDLDDTRFEIALVDGRASRSSRACRRGVAIGG